MAVGTPTTKEYRIVFPTSAFKTSTATMGPGCGGTSPCMTERPETNGMPICSNGILVFFAMMNTSGISNHGVLAFAHPLHSRVRFCSELTEARW